MQIGREFGLALQTVNVIRGLHADWRRGWVYVPRSFAGDGSGSHPPPRRALHRGRGPDPRGPRPGATGHQGGAPSRGGGRVHRAHPPPVPQDPSVLPAPLSVCRAHPRAKSGQPGGLPDGDQNPAHRGEADRTHGRDLGVVERLDRLVCRAAGQERRGDRVGPRGLRVPSATTHDPGRSLLQRRGAGLLRRRVRHHEGGRHGASAPRLGAQRRRPLPRARTRTLLRRPGVLPADPGLRGAVRVTRRHRRERCLEGAEASRRQRARRERARNPLVRALRTEFAHHAAVLQPRRQPPARPETGSHRSGV